MIRNVRNSNPGNIEVGAHWNGLLDRMHMNPLQEAEHRFCVFRSPCWGFRALAIVLRSYGEDGLETLTQYIERWAPANENDPKAYRWDVEQKTGWDANHTVNHDDPVEIGMLAKAIASHETAGGLPYDKSFDPYWSEDDLDAGVRAAFAPH
jgi:hypothetical protein